MSRPPLTALLATLVATCLLVAFPAFCHAGDKPPRGRHLDLEVDRYTHDFGPVKQDDVRKTTFTYKNVTDHVVDDITAKGECGCNAVTLSKTRLEPGETGTLTVEFNTLTLSGKLHKRVHLFTKDRKRGRALIELDIAIVDGVVVRPPALSFKEVHIGTHPSKSFYVRWYEGLTKPFEITEVSVPGYEKDIGVKITPNVYEKDPKWKGYQVELTILRELPLGMFSAEVLVRTTNKDRPRFTLPFSANVHNKVWMQMRRLTFGKVPAGEGRTRSIKFRPIDSTVHFGTVTATTRKGIVKVEVEPDPFLAKEGYWKLIGTVPKDTPPGRIDGEVIEIHTGVPGEEVVEVEVIGSVAGRH